MLTKVTKALALTSAATLLAVGAVTGAAAHENALQDDGVIDSGKDTHAHAAQHGANTGHLAPVGPTKGLSLLSKTRLSNVVEGKIADVGVLKTTAYLAAWGGQTCDRTGVYVVDVANLASPREIGFIPAKAGSYSGEGVQALSVSTPAFTGDLLVTNTETCDAATNVGGVNLYDVTTPSAPVTLVENYGDDSGTANKNAHETHSAFAWDAGDRAYAVLVDNEEAADVDIVDISNPSKPAFVAEYDLAALFPQILQPGKDLDEVFLHDMVVKQIGGRWIMLASYWDGGYVQLDVTNPAAASYVKDSNFALIDPEAAESGLQVAPEGNAHQAEFTKDNAYVLAADEDFSPFALTGRNTTDGSDFVSAQGSDTPKLGAGATLSGQTKFGGRGCSIDAAVPPGDGAQIAVIERGSCTFTEKVASVEKAGGYRAVVIFNRTAADGCNNSLGMGVSGTLPTFGVAPRAQGFALFNAAYDNAACLAGDGTQLAPIAVGALGDTLTFTSYFDGWGYVHLYDRTTMTELDTYAIPEAHDPAFANGFGDLSVHEVATSSKDSSLAYVSSYAGGLRVIDVEQVKGARGGPKIVEKAAHIDAAGNNFWGVETFLLGGKEYVAASDRDLGLYLYEYTPVNAP